MNVFDKEKKDEIINDIIELREEKTRRQLLNSFDKFKKAVIKTVANDQVGVDFIISVEAKTAIANKELELLDEEGIISEDIRQRLLQQSSKLENAREIRKLIKDTKSLIEIRKICK